MSRADFRSELMGGLNAPLGVEDSRRHQSVRRTTEKRLDVRLDRTGQAFDGGRVATITASILAPRSLSEHLRSGGIPSTVDISTPAADALRLAVSILRAAQDAGLTLPAGLSVH